MAVPQANAVMDVDALPVVPPSVQCVAVVPFRWSADAKASPKALKQKYLADLAGKPIEESLKTLRAALETAEVPMQLVTEAETLRQEQIDCARKDLNSLKDAVTKAIEEEVEAAKVYKERKATSAQVSSKVAEQSQKLLDAQKKVAMLEVFKTNQVAMLILQEKRDAAVKAAQEVKRSIQEHKQNEKKALDEARRKALEEVRRLMALRPGGKRHRNEAGGVGDEGAAPPCKAAKILEKDAEGQRIKKDADAEAEEPTRKLEAEPSSKEPLVDEAALCYAGA